VVPSRLGAEGVVMVGAAVVVAAMAQELPQELALDAVGLVAAVARRLPRRHASTNCPRIAG
jgi:hypothetical protein